MFAFNEEDLSVQCTRGDYCNFPVSGEFKPGDVVRFKAFRKKDCATVVIQRDFTVDEATNTFVISLTGEDTKIGEVISKPVDYWYEVELNPDTNPQTIVAYDEKGAKLFKLFPEGKDVDAEDIEVVGKKTLQELVDYALEQAKESGAFDGKDGQDGKDGKDGVDGKDGYTPVKGEDYFTEEEKAEIVEDATEKAEQNCANALKAKVSGDVIRVDDVSPFNHTARAIVTSKNLWTVNNTTANNISYDEETQILTMSGAANAYLYALPDPIPKGTTVTITATVISGKVTSNADGGLAFGGYNKPSSGATSWQGYINVPKFKEEDITGKVFMQTAEVTADVTHFYAFAYAPTATIHEPLKLKIQYEIGDTATAYEQHIDPATVGVTRCGKNLVPYPFYNKTKTENGITFTDHGNGIITASGTATDNAFFHFVIESTTRVKGVYTLSGLSGGSGTTYYIQPFISGSAVRGLTNGSYLYEFDGILDKITMVVTKGTTIDNLEVKLQLEQGDKATAFEPYKVEEYTPAADGSCDIVPASPTMTIFADTPGANIEVEYNQDTNKAIGNIESALDAIIAIQNSLIGGDGA